MTTQPTPTDLLAHWRVAVEANGVVLVAIESDGHLAGCEISEHDEQTIRTCAQHLLAFIGDTTLSAREAGWQPIETLPRDATVVVVIEATADNRTYGASGHQYVCPAYIDEDGIVCDAGSSSHPDIGIKTGMWRAVAWQPLPPPPKAPTAGEGK